MWHGQCRALIPEIRVENYRYLIRKSLYAQVPIYVYDEGVAIDLDGVDFEAIESDFVAGGGG